MVFYNLHSKAQTQTHHQNRSKQHTDIAYYFAATQAYVIAAGLTPKVVAALKAPCFSEHGAFFIAWSIGYCEQHTQQANTTDTDPNQSASIKPSKAAKHTNQTQYALAARWWGCHLQTQSKQPISVPIQTTER